MALIIKFLELNLCVDDMLADIFQSTRLDDFFNPKTIYHNAALWEEGAVSRKAESLTSQDKGCKKFADAHPVARSRSVQRIADNSHLAYYELIAHSF